MPQQISAVRYSVEERAQLRDAVNGNSIKAVSGSLATGIKALLAETSVVVKRDDLDANELQKAKEELGAVAAFLTSIPDSLIPPAVDGQGEPVGMYRASVQKAVQLVDEALRLLGV